MKRVRRGVEFAILAFLSSVLSCSSDATSAEIQRIVDSVVVNLGLTTLTVGQTVQAAAIARDASGVAATTVAISWASSNTDVATISSTGLVTAVAPGQTEISAAAQGSSAQATVTVVAVPVATVTVSLSASAARVGQSITATAATFDAKNAAITGRRVDWSSTNPAVATVSSAGTVTTVGAGATNVVATSEGRTGSAPLVVQADVGTVNVTLATSSLQPGKSTLATATVRDPANNVVSGTPVTWRSSDISVATVTSGGEVTAVAPGTAAITATSEGIGGSAVLTVQAAISSVTVALGATSLKAGEVTSATAVARDQSNNVVTGKPVAWASSNAAVASITPVGFIAALASGTTTISATVDGLVGTATLTVAGLGGGGGGGGGQTPTQLVIVTQPSNVASGVNFSPAPVVQVRDASNSLVSIAGVSVTAALANGTGTLAGTTVVTTTTGVATFADLRVSGSGPHTLTFSASGLTAATSTSFVVASQATQLAIVTQPSSTAQSAVAFAQQPVIQLRDASNNAISQAGVVVTAAIATGTGTLAGTTTATTNANGVATFSSLSISGSGAQTLRFTASGLTQATSSSITVNAPVGDTQAPSVAITSPTSGATYATSASAVTLSGTASDNVGVTQVTWSSDRGGAGTATGTTTWSASNIALQSGSNVVTVTARDAANNVATKTLTVTYTVPSPTATELAITTQPSSAAQPGVAFATQPALQLRDASHVAVSQAGVVVTAAIATGGGTVGGTTTATTNASGVAMFSNLSISGVDGGRTLSFTAPGLTGATSGTVTVTAPVGSPPTTLLSETFESTNFSARGWYDLPNGDITSLVTTDHAPGSTKSLQMHWNTGETTSGISARHSITPSDAVYLTYWIKHSSNWVGSGVAYGPHMIHFLTNEDGAYIGPAATHLTTYIEETFLPNGGVASLGAQDALNIDATRINQDLTNVTESRAVSGCNGNTDGTPGGCYQGGAQWINGKTWQSSQPIFGNAAGPTYKGDWHQVAVYLKLNSIVNGKGQLDGIARYWVDGVLAIDKPNVLFRTGAHATMKFNQFFMAPYLGDGSPVSQTIWIDDLTITTAPPAGGVVGPARAQRP